ncbi:MAG: alpha/beta hydrolase [Acidobacteriota bacterium]
MIHLLIDSTALKGNLLGDPATRTVAVYLPADYDHSDLSYPVFVNLASFGGSGLQQISWRLFGENVPQRIDRLVALQRMGPVVAVFPDCFTSLGGNQYINSIAMGKWEDFLLAELIPRIETEFRVRKGAGNRAVFGFSSGGFGAITHGLLHGQWWGAVACHSGDMGFDWVYRPDLPKALNILAEYDGNVEHFFKDFEDSPKVRGDRLQAMMILAMSASYDPDPAQPRGVRLPVHPHTCELDPERWARWKAHDPVELVKRAECRRRLQSLKGLYIDCGKKDQFQLHYGTRTFVNQLEAFGISHHYEEFDDNHSGVDYRLDVSLPFLYEAVA